MLKLFNTLTKKKEEFKPLKNKTVGLYTCGPTVYDYDHIGHAWNYVNSDILRRVLEYDGYKVKHVMNITDVGHLTSDADEGEDKMEKSAKEKGQTAKEIAEYYTKIYLENRHKLNLLEPKVICKATDHIKEMIKLVEKLLDQGFAYETSDGIYFDTSKFKDYGKLSGNTLDQLKEGARIEKNPEKKNPTDFALWKFSPKGEKRQMEWQAFKRNGFPGWHIECSAMSMKYLGNTLDVHTGGEDNIFPHHECEIAQSEVATGKKFVNFWFHTRFLQVDGKKMSKSLKNFYTLEDLEKKGFSALDLRYLYLTAHYRSKLNFTWESLAGAKASRLKLVNQLADLGKPTKANKEFVDKFKGLINDDLAMPQALALVWEVLKSKLKDGEKVATILEFDKVFGLELNKVEKVKVPKEVLKLAKEREAARENKDWAKADKLRKEIEKTGYLVEDTAEGSKIVKK